MTTPDRAQFLARFAYLGSSFHGVQEQPHVTTVLGALRKRIETASGQYACALYVAARTDRGVHALENFATFFLKSPPDLDAFREHMATDHGDGLFAVNIWRVPKKTHARGSNSGKTYRYTMLDNMDPLEPDASHPFAWKITPMLQVEQMTRAAAALIGEHDFSSFRGSGCQAGSPIKEICSIEVKRVSNTMVIIEITGRGFLRKMIRNMVGILVEIGAGLRSPNCIAEILAAKKRTEAGVMAPAQGLCLVKVNLETPCA